MMKAMPFTINISDDVLMHIRAKLEYTRVGYCPDDDSGWRYGTDAGYLDRLISYWRDGYDWRAQERALNRWPQYKAEINGAHIHFYHVRGDGSRPAPILMTHGWPGSIVEFQAAIPLLVAAGYDLVVPSLPGFGWSDPPRRPIGTSDIAAMWRALMVDVLGYRRFYVQGGDFGSPVSERLGGDHCDVVAAVHLNFFQGPAPTDSMDPPLAAYWARVGRYMQTEGSYALQQMSRPQTIGLALYDNPLGWASWTIEKFQRWADNAGDIERRFTKDQLITNLMTYLVTDNVIASMWIYHASAAEQDDPLRPVTVPTALALYPGEIYPMPDRELASRQYNIARWSEMPEGGHFAAMEVPEIFARDVIEFFDSCSS